MSAEVNSIESMVRTRRARLENRRFPDHAKGLWGLALSGGGIRSATFCFGLLRALARNDVLLRLDLVSTVSGGGYIGAMLGRLFSRARSADDVNDINAAMKDASSRWFAWWLRANGRYLTPRGARDWTYAVALYVRNLVGIHFEFGLIAALLGVLMAATDVVVWQHTVEWGYADPQHALRVLRYLPGWLSVVALLEIPLLLVSGAVAIAYWSVPAVVKTRSLQGIALLGLWLVVSSIEYHLWPWHPWLPTLGTTEGAHWRFGLALSGCLLIAAWTGAVPLTYLARILSPVSKTTIPEEPERQRTQADAMRTRLTKWLALCFRLAAIVFGLALVDRAAWFIAFDLQSVGHVGVGLGIIATVLRAVFPKLAQLTPGRPSTELLLGGGRILGYVLTFVLCAWWVSLIYAAGLGALFQHAGPNFGAALMALGVIGAPVLLYMLVTESDMGFLNLSSLHGFYRARLIRSYLGAANSDRLVQPAPLGAIQCLPAAMSLSPKLVAVGDIQIDDDLRFCDFTSGEAPTFCGYAPYLQGGPVHLINMCINQTRDPRGGLFNQDRRGLALCVASGGLMKVGQCAWEPLPRDDMTLGTWTAISGAAVAPGLGSLTRGGISALAFFAGVRLGYWWKAKPLGRLSPHRLYAKSVGLLAETFGIFRGATTSNWFLTDGGHFENTGAYALLAERAELIIVADCGADPHYAFGDLENLVRKARIDLQAEIVFQRPVAPRENPGKFDETMALFGSLNDLASDRSTACLALATISYAGEAKSHGFLILIKPNISNGLPVDLINFKAQNPAFPQETTADQWFTEAQWESYSQLGYHLGENLQQEFIAAVMAHPATFFEDDDQQPLDQRRQVAAAPDAAASPAISRLPSRIASATVRAGVGVGAIATLAVSMWQGIEGSRSSHVRRTADERAALKELTDLWARIPPRPQADPEDNAVRTATIGELAAAIARTADTLCPAAQDSLFRKFPVALSVFNSTLTECAAVTPGNRPNACTTLLEAADPRLQSPYPNCLVRYQGASPAIPPPHYWVYDYAETAPVALAHPCDNVAARRRAARAGYQTSSLAPNDLAGLAAQSLRYERDARCALSEQEQGDLVGVDVPPANRITAAAAAAPASCQGRMVYPLVYGPQQLAAVNAYRLRWTGLGAQVTHSENVVEAAWGAGRATPLVVAETTVRYNDAGSLACAKALQPPGEHGTWRVEPVSPLFATTPDVIEVWLAPTS